MEVWLAWATSLVALATMLPVLWHTFTRREV